MYVFMPCLFEQEINGSSWIGCRWCFSSLSDNGCNFFGPPNIFHHEVFSTTRYIPNSDILGHKEFSTQRHSWLQLFPPPNIFSNEAFSKPKTFSATRHFQVQFLGSRSITSSWNMRKMEKRVSYHCSDKIMFVRLIQNESLTPTPTWASYAMMYFPLRDIFRTVFDQLPAPEIWKKKWKKGIISLLR